jgi:hypothetical protein
MKLETSTFLFLKDGSVSFFKDPYTSRNTIPIKGKSILLCIGIISRYAAIEVTWYAFLSPNASVVYLPMFDHVLKDVEAGLDDTFELRSVTD